ncbi:MAG TPA: UDP-N-acetylmuramate--L-alanine ligase [Kofleriaceae bacterium]|nr:UDP-N-acetylmuramate--L-alanine ligase [Kofleriaceae bacterium]
MKIHLIGIGGTGMGAVAGLLAAAGHDVRGSDVAVYPPMSEQLAALGVPVFTPYAAENLDWQPDMVVVGNVHGKDHVEVLAAQARNIELTSFPAVLGKYFLADRHSVVVSGTHGKTTTTSLLAHILTAAGRDPGLFVGGVPITLGAGYHYGKGPEFVVEGDEYDTAFFDKGSKFLHYRPQSVVLTSIELDHVDIFSSFEAVRAAFAKFIALIPSNGLLVVANDSADAVELAQKANCAVERYAVMEGDNAAPEGVTWWATNLSNLKSGRLSFDVFRRSGATVERLERFETLLPGRHNVANCVAAIAVCVGRGLTVDQIVDGISSFAGVRRRQELRGIAGGVVVLDDYGHHPTAVRETLKALRGRFANRRLFAVYDPRSATSRRKTFQQDFATAFAHADEVVVGKLFDPSKIPVEDRFDPEKLALDLHRSGTPATYLPEVDQIVKHLAERTAPGDVVCALSSGSFDGFHDRLLDAIGDAMRPGRRIDMVEVRQLLSDNQLTTDGASDAQFPVFFVLRDETGVIGCVALEVFGDDAVLRALAVASSRRGGGYGWMLADLAVSQARYRGVRRIYLLTETASDFFAAKFGFRAVDRSTISAKVAGSQPFKADGSTSAVAMRLDL